MYATNENKPYLTTELVGRLDKVVETIGLDVNRDKYFSITRDVLRSNYEDCA